MHEKKRQKKERDKKEGRDELGGLASVFHCVNFDSRLTFLNFRACDIWFVRGLHEKNKYVIKIAIHKLIIFVIVF